MQTLLGPEPMTAACIAGDGQPISGLRAQVPLDLAVILPTYNERENIPLVIARLKQALRGLAWEAIFVDDDSPDGTAEAVLAFARHDCRIRLIHRIARRGLGSACIEGMLATPAAVIAVMDADLQHDETILPAMLGRLRAESLDVVVGTRNADGGSMGEFNLRRVVLSRVGQKISNAVCRCELTDPMSGFFMLRRDFLLDTVRDLQGGGFKILVDLLASRSRPVRLGEVGYTFGVRSRGESKLDVVVCIEYLLLIVNSLLGGIMPLRLALYALVGGLGLITHLAMLLALRHLWHVPFVAAQTTATFTAMTENFFLNNLITFRDRPLRGTQMLLGGARFVAVCGFGAWANVVFARALYQSGAEWYLAGLAGIVLGSVWNLSISSLFTWRMRMRPERDTQAEEAFASNIEVYR
jgi:dolichol-phosphate mannosyltransferase